MNQKTTISGGMKGEQDGHYADGTISRRRFPSNTIATLVMKLTKELKTLTSKSPDGTSPGQQQGHDLPNDPNDETKNNISRGTEISHSNQVTLIWAVASAGLYG